MKTCSSWDEFSAFSREHHYNGNTKSRISLSGYFKPWINPGEPVPNDVLRLSRSLEILLAEAYAGLKVSAAETPHSDHPSRPDHRYYSLAVGVEGKDIVQIDCSIKVTHLKSQDLATNKEKPFYPSQPKFYFIFPLDRYEDATKRVIHSIWNHIDAFADVQTAPPSEYDKRKPFGPQEIIITKNGKLVFVGHSAIHEIGLHQLPTKEARTLDYVVNLKK